MNRKNRSLLTLPVAMLLVACGGQDAGDTLTVADKPLPEDRPSVTETPGSPGTVFEFSYEIVGTPIVGSPVSIDLEIQSAFGDEAIEVGYQIPDSTALAMDAAQPRTLTRTPLAGERSIRERVTVISATRGPAVHQRQRRPGEQHGVDVVGYLDSDPCWQCGYIGPGAW